MWSTFAPSEGRGWIEKAIAVADEQANHKALARLWCARAYLAMLAMQYKLALSSADRARGLSQDVGDELIAAEATMLAGAAKGLLGEKADSEPLLLEALGAFRGLGARRWIAATLSYLAGARLNAGEGTGARPILAEALTLYRDIGAARPAAHLSLVLAEVEFQAGNAQAAVMLVRQALEDERSLREFDGVAFDLANLAAYEIHLGCWKEALDAAREGFAIARERSLESATLWCVQHVAAIAALAPAMQIAERERAAALCGFTDRRIDDLGLQRHFTERAEYERMNDALLELPREILELRRHEGRGWDEARVEREVMTLVTILEAKV
jgi:tetratricopeptide (TPR) repeat protein